MSIQFDTRDPLETKSIGELRRILEEEKTMREKRDLIEEIKRLRMKGSGLGMLGNPGESKELAPVWYTCSVCGGAFDSSHNCAGKRYPLGSPFMCLTQRGL